MTESMPRPLPALRRGGFESAVVADTIVEADDNTVVPLPLPAADVVVSRVGEECDDSRSGLSGPVDFLGTLKRRLPLEAASGLCAPAGGLEMHWVDAAAAARPSADGGRVSDFLLGNPHRVISTEQSDWSLLSLSLNQELVLPPSLPSEPSRRLRCRPRKSERLRMERWIEALSYNHAAI